MTTLFCDPTPSCPRCGAEGALPLIFGTPSREMLIAEQLGQIALGGSIESARIWNGRAQALRAGAISKAPRASQAPL